MKHAIANIKIVHKAYGRMDVKNTGHSLRIPDPKDTKRRGQESVFFSPFDLSALDWLGVLKKV